MKKKDLLQIHMALKDAKLKGLKTEFKMMVLQNIRKTTPIAIEYEESLKSAQEKCKPEGFDDLLKKARDNEGKPDDERTITRDEINSLNQMSAEFNKEISLFQNKIENEIIDVTIEKLPQDEFGKFMDANPEFTALQFYFVPVE